MIDPMTEVFALRDTDPRLCPNGNPHRWMYNMSRCHICNTTPAIVADRYRDWRYEQVIEQLTAALDRLAERFA